LALVLLSKASPQPDDAIALLTQVLENMPDYPRALLVRGQAHLMAKHFEAATADLEQVLKESPNDAAALKLLAAAKRK